MNIFIVAHPRQKTASEERVRQLASIHYEQGRTVPVIVVDDHYDWSALPVNNAPTDHVGFELEDFRRSIIDNSVDINKIAHQMDRVDSQWVLIDFGRHDEALGLDFISKLSRYRFQSTALCNRSLIFSVPTASLHLFARVLNGSFNNLPVSGAALAQPGQLRGLLWAAHAERVLMSLPLLRGALSRIRHLLVRIFRRFARAA